MVQLCLLDISGTYQLTHEKDEITFLILKNVFQNPAYFISYRAHIPCLLRKVIERNCAMACLQDSIALKTYVLL